MGTSLLYDQDYPTPPPFYDSKNLEKVTLSTIHSVCVHWLNFPKETPTRFQAIFFSIMGKVFGPEIGYLPSVWRAYHKIPHNVLGHRSSRVTAANLDHFSQFIAQHPFSNPVSSEYKLIKDIGIAMEAFISSLKAPPMISSTIPQKRHQVSKSYLPGSWHSESSSSTFSEGQASREYQIGLLYQML